MTKNYFLPSGHRIETAWVEHAIYVKTSPLNSEINPDVRHGMELANIYDPIE